MNFIASIAAAGKNKMCIRDRYEEQLKKLGLKSDASFSCTCYMDQVGNLPKKGDILSWAES